MRNHHEILRKGIRKKKDFSGDMTLQLKKT